MIPDFELNDIKPKFVYIEKQTFYDWLDFVNQIIQIVNSDTDTSTGHQSQQDQQDTKDKGNQRPAVSWQ